jgi:hypothetical protein
LLCLLRQKADVIFELLYLQVFMLDGLVQLMASLAILQCMKTGLHHPR